MQVGLFGLAGAAGAIGAAVAGRLADRGHVQRTTAVGLMLMLAAWLPILLMHRTLAFLALGALLISSGLQAVHVSNQSLIYAMRPDARSRLVAGYMVFYSIGSARGLAGRVLRRRRAQRGRGGLLVADAARGSRRSAAAVRRYCLMIAHAAGVTLSSCSRSHAASSRPSRWRSRPGRVTSQ
jgi:MFS family permease